MVNNYHMNTASWYDIVVIVIVIVIVIVTMHHDHHEQHTPRANTMNMHRQIAKQSVTFMMRLSNHAIAVSSL